MSFENIIGNEKVKIFLEKQIEENHILHSYLFLGIEGIGKELFAKEFAKKILCLNKEKEENCLSCIKWNSNNHPDFYKIEPENNTIKIEQIRNMQEKILEKPITSSKKVYIIKDSDLMTKEAQNCLLKTLEEPPEFITIILIATNENKLLTTIKSRCMKITFEKIEEKEIQKYLENTLQEEVLEELIKYSQGSIGKALKIQEDKTLYKQVNELLENIESKSLIDILNKAEVLYKEKEKIYEILDYINIYLYNTKETKKLNCIFYIEEVKKRLLASSNYDMCIDNLIINLHKQINTK